MTSIREIRRLVNKYCDYEVSKECLVYLKESCEEVNSNVIRQIIEEFEENNKIRERAGIPKYKRIKGTYIKVFCEKLLKAINVFNGGNGGNASTNITTSLSEAGEIT